MSDDQTHLKAVDRFIAASKDRIAGHKLCIVELEDRGKAASHIIKSIQQAEKTLATMMTYRDTLVSKTDENPASHHWLRTPLAKNKYQGAT